MLSWNLKQCLSLAMALVMVLSLMPVSTRAEEENNPSAPEAEVIVTEKSTLLEGVAETEVPQTTASAEVEITVPVVEEIEDDSSIQKRIDAILNQYGITSDMADDDIADAIFAADGDTVKATMDEMDSIDIDAQSMSEEALYSLETDLYERFRNVWDAIFSATPAVTVTGVSGVEVTCDSSGTISESGGTVTVTVSGSFTTRKTTTITIKNTSGSTATISFSATASNHDTSVSTIDDLGGSYSGNLTAGATKTITLCSKRFTSNTTGTATLSNFSVTIASTKYNVALAYDNAKGSVTIDGAASAPGTYQLASANLVATANSGCSFLGWIDSTTGKILTKDSTYPGVFTSAANVTAVFTNASSNAWFMVDNAYLTNDLNKATTLGSTIVLMYDAILPADNYTIPSGDTLLIPFDSANTLYTTEPGTLTYDRDNGETFSTYTPAAYRTLTMASGAKITVNGAISVSAKHCATQSSNGAPVDAYGLIKMQSGSTITIENGGALYAWGYITGSGSVVAKSGASVYENFQLRDWRGGTATSSINDSRATYRVFPFSQYYVQNIEVPLTLYAGAKEYALTSFDITLVGIKSTTVPFVGTSDAMFILSSGYVVKDYIENTGRIKVSVYGDISISPMTITIRVDLFSSVTLNTDEFILPLSGHMTVDIQSGTLRLAQDLALLPGCEIYLRDGTNFVLGSGNSLYVYDWGNWGDYCYVSNYKYMTLEYVPGGNGTTGREKDAMIQVDGTADLSAGYIYTTTNGANICSTGTGVVKLAPGTETVAYQITQSGTSIKDWNEIPITPAKLLNGDGTTYVETADGAGTYKYSGTGTAGKWIKLIDIYGTSIRAGDNLAISFYVNSSDFDSQKTYTAKFVRTRQGVADDSTEVTGTVTSEGYLRFIYTDIAAKEMTDEVYITVYDSDGYQISQTTSESVQKYALRSLSRADDTKAELRTALIDMLNYGAAAQNFFKDYNINDLATTGAESYQKYATTETRDYTADDTTSNVNLYAASISAESNLVLTFYFQNISKDMSAVATYRDHYGNSKKVTISGDSFYANGDLLGVDVEGLAVADGKNAIQVTCIVTDSEGNEVAKGIASVEGYVAATIAQAEEKSETVDNVYYMLMKFVDSAYAYFRSLES